MERLTSPNKSDRFSEEELKESTTRRMINKLADYEDAEAEGRLVVLPCKVGDLAYGVENGCGARGCRDCASDGNCTSQGWHIEECKTNERFWAMHRHLLCKTVFLTRPEAEAALKTKEGE